MYRLKYKLEYRVSNSIVGKIYYVRLLKSSFFHILKFEINLNPNFFSYN